MTEKQISRILLTGMEGNRAGTENMLMNWYRRIDRSLIQFDFLVPHTLKEGFPYEQEILSLGGHIYREEYGIKEKPFTYRRDLRRLLKIHPEIKGVHMNVNMMTDIAAIQAADDLQLPVRIIHSHNGGHPANYNWKVKMLEDHNKRIINRQSFTKIACSDLAGKFMFGHESLYTVFPNAIDTKKFAYKASYRSEIRKKYGIAEDQMLIGFIGRLNYQKNPLFLLQIFNVFLKKNPDAVLLILGDGELLGECKSYIYTEKIENHVIFAGQSDQSEKYYSAMDLFLLPSRFEGLPLVLLEAQCSGLPCLASDQITQEASATELVHTLSITNSAQTWADEMSSILSAAFTRTGYDNVMKQKGFDIDAYVDRLQNLYLKMLEREHG